MELVGTVVLPAAISFTIYVIISVTYTWPVSWLPLFARLYFWITCHIDWVDYSQDCLRWVDNYLPFC